MRICFSRGSGSSGRKIENDGLTVSADAEMGRTFFETSELVFRSGAIERTGCGSATPAAALEKRPALLLSVDADFLSWNLNLRLR